MLIYYRKSILKLLQNLHNARKYPFADPVKWKILQEELIKRIIRAENKVRTLKAQKKQLNQIRKDSFNRLSKTDSIKMKAGLVKIEYLLTEYRNLINIYKSIGDGIAFTFLSKYDIKPQNFKQSSGFITEKSGFSKEIQIFRAIYKKGGIALFNDITSSLKYCDVTIITEEGFSLLEIKTKANRNNERIDRQFENANKLLNYLENDIVEDLYGKNGTMTRIESKSEESNHIEDLSKLINASKELGSVYHSPEPGLLYHISHSDNFEDSEISNVLKQHNFEKPYFFYLNSMKFSGQGYYPFSLSFEPSDYLDFLEGNFTFIIFVDKKAIQNLCHYFGFEAAESGQVNFPFKFVNKSPNQDMPEFILVSNHFFSRVAMEFVSLRWLISTSCERIKPELFDIV